MSGFCVAHLFEIDLRKLRVNESHYSQCMIMYKGTTTADLHCFCYA